MSRTYDVPAGAASLNVTQKRGMYTSEDSYMQTSDSQVMHTKGATSLLLLNNIYAVSAETRTSTVSAEVED